MFYVLILLFTILGIFFWKSNHLKTITNFPRELRLIYRFMRAILRFKYSQLFNINVTTDFDRVAKSHPHKVCFYFEEEEWTFAQVEKLVNQVANYFRNKGLSKGDKVAIFMENRVQYICLWLGLAKIGVVSALINTNLRMGSLTHCLKAAKSKSLIYGTELSGAVKEIYDQGHLNDHCLYEFSSKTNSELDLTRSAVDLNSELEKSSSKPPMKPKLRFSDELMYIYTSGTTGLPKAAIIKHSRYMMICLGSTYVGTLTPKDIFYVPLPLYHAAGTIVGIGQALLNGNSVVIVKKFSASKFWKDCRRYGATAFQYIGETCRYVLAQPERLDDQDHQIRVMLGNGLRAEIWTQFINRFGIKNVCEFYASTEGNCGLVNVDNRVGAVGYFPALLSVLISSHLIKVDEVSGEPLRDPVSGLCIKCGPNETGELIGLIKGKDPMSDFAGYTEEGSRDKKILKDVLKKGDRAFRSGDILIKDEDGYYFFKDRQGDTYRWKGENVSTMEVEGVISKACGLVDTAVYGVEIPGAEGRAGMAAITDKEDKIDLQTVVSQCSIQLPSYAMPVFIRKLKQMDLTGTFKVKKVDLQKDGFDITKVNDPIYIFAGGVYKRLNLDLYNQIMEGKIRV